MSEYDRIRLGRQILDEALQSLAMPVAALNPDFELRSASPGVRLYALLLKPGVAPFSFHFGHELDVWVGPFSELVVLDVAELQPSDLVERVRALLVSEVRYVRSGKTHRLRLQVPGGQPWVDLKVRSVSESSLLPYYEAYAGRRLDESGPT